MELSKRDKNRIVNSLRNVFASAFFQTVLGIVAFVERTVFIKCLNADYLGLNSLFSNILYFLSIAELGIGSAIAFALYKPLADDNQEKIYVYMRFFRKAYRIIGSLIIFAGLAFSPFIKYVANSSEEIVHLQSYFILYLLAVGLTYYFSYGQIIIEADQKKYINQSITCLGSILQSIMQIIILLTTRNYGLYIAIFFIFNVGKNIILRAIVRKLYPILNSKKYHGSELTKDERKKITSNVKALCFHKFGEVAIGSSDSFLISYLVDLKSLGLYANYLIIIDALKNAMRVFYSSILASIGNMCATEDDEKIFNAFLSLNFVNYLLFSYITVLIYNLIQPIITIWLGRKFLLPQSSVFLISSVFLFNGIRAMLINFHDALGLFWADKYKRILEAILNIFLSFLLGRHWGLDGILIGTIASNILGFLIEGYVVYKYAFSQPYRNIVFLYLKELSTSFFVLIVTSFFVSLVDLNSFLNIVYRVVICILIPWSIYLIFYRSKPEFIAVRTSILSILRILFAKIRGGDGHDSVET